MVATESDDTSNMRGTAAAPIQGTSFMDTWMFSFMTPMVSKARKGAVELNDCMLPTDQTANVAYEKFAANWSAATAATPNPNLRKVLLKTFGGDLALAGLWKLMWSCCVIMGAFFFVRTLQFHVADHPHWKEDYQGWILAVFFFVDAWLLGVSLQRMSVGCTKVGISMRAAITNAVCRKAFAMPSITKEQSADCVNFIASDIVKIFDGVADIHYLWTAPIEAVAILTILTVLVGKWAIPGWALVAVVMGCQYIFGYRIILHKKANSANIQARSAIFQELLPAMKLVKYYAWEKYFEEEVATIRAKERKHHWWVALIKTVQITMVLGTPPGAALVIFGLYEAFSGLRLTSTLTFPILSLFNILRVPLVVLPKAMRALSDALAAIEKIEIFLNTPTAVRQELSKTSTGINISNAELKHPESKTSFTLKVPEFIVKPGELVAVCGRVGAGKTSLFNAILGNMQLMHGSSNCGGQVAYVPQDPWCQNLSLRDSILFGSNMDEERYDEVISACALELDLQILPSGDQSMAGLRGMNLSGGQRQRLNVARAAYCDTADLVLLDNALSAVDAHTAEHIFEHCIKGLMHDKAVVLITHQVAFLPKCDKLAIMDEGNMIYFGPWNAAAKEQLSKLLPASHMLAAAGNAEQPREMVVEAGKKKLVHSCSQPAVTTKAEHRSGLTLKEALWEFVANSPWFGVVFVFSVFIFMTVQTARQISDWWLRQWTTDARKWYDCDQSNNPCGTTPEFPFQGLDPSSAYVIVYMIIVLFFILCLLPRGAGFYWWSLSSGQKIHVNAVHNTLFAPLGFFLQNPVGELLLAFTRDQDIMDENLVDSWHYLAFYGLIMLTTVITVSTFIYYFAIFAGVLIIVTFGMLWYYLPCATKIKAHIVKTQSQLVGLVAETVEGLHVIQAFDKTSYFVQTAIMRNDLHHRTVYTGESLNLWLAHRCDFYGAIMVLGVSCMAVALKYTLGAATVGLAFSNVMQMIVFYTWSVRFFADALFQMSSVEKLGWLAKEIPIEGAAKAILPPGGPNDPSDMGKNLDVDSANIVVHIDPVGHKGGEDINLDADGAPENWPSRGTVVFDNVWMRYSSNAPFALKGVSFSLQPQEKVGIVGRTGSGKSTCLLALYRLFELDKGAIYVDGVNVASMTLSRLRRGLSIMPQEPVIFSGTVRTNLDPFNEHTDNELYEVIREASLEEQVKRAGGLQGRLSGTGSGAWSLGQQQLVCLARAALRAVPVLCLDEATAAMDPHTEKEVQDVIKRVFDHRTIITIAHRLDTVIESDKVIVMETGVLKECAPPSQLLADPNSMFSLLVDKSGKQAAAALRDMATEFFASRAASAHTRL
ncbi:hypothetical protein FOA52_006006 [Chlamydomonas sp. UWO 241]|nr:hypothetical protein FOA52_006006 [Chlamydomonas sp. UWO 241]